MDTLPNLSPESYAPEIKTNRAGDSVFYTINRAPSIAAEFHFNLTFDCDIWDETSPIRIPFVTTARCGDCYEDDIHCGAVEMVPHCPGCDAAISTTSFTSKRTTAGFTDETMSSRVDLSEANHALNYLLPYDTFTLTAPGVISGTETENVFFRLEYTPQSGGIDVTQFADGEVTFYDVDGEFGSNYHTFPVPTPTIIDVGGGNYEALFDFTPTMDLIDPNFVLGRGAGGVGTFAKDSLNISINFVLKKSFSKSVIYELLSLIHI